MPQSEKAPGVRGPKKGHVPQSEFAHKTPKEFDDLEWSECNKGMQYAPTTRKVGGVEVPATAVRPCAECTSSGCPWRPEYRIRVDGA